MSVGIARLRDEPERIRQGAIDKREDPALVDRAIEMDATRRRLQAESDTLKAERNVVSKQVGEAIKGGARPDGPVVAELKARSTTAGTRITEIDAELTTTEQQLEDLLLRIPNPADPEVPVGGEEANVTVRTWGENRSRVVTEADGTTWERKPHWEMARRSTSSTTPAAPRSRARASRSTRARARGSSARSSCGSSTSTRVSTASPRSGRPPW